MARFQYVLGLDLLVLFGEAKYVHTLVCNLEEEQGMDAFVSILHFEKSERLEEYEQQYSVSISESLGELMMEHGTFQY